MSQLAIGVDIGGGSIKAGLYNRKGAELIHQVVATPVHLTNDTFLEAVFQSIEPLLHHPGILGIGIGSPGPLDNERGILIESANMPSLKHVPIKEYCNQKFNLPIFYENDANCAALGEAVFGEYKHLSSLLILTLGTGIGGGFVDRGVLFSGYQGNGIEIGHMTAVINGAVCGCGQRGCLETYFSTKGLIARYLEKTNQTLLDAKEFFDQVESKNPIALEILNFGILAMAETVRSAIHLLNPEGVIFVGGITSAWHLFGDRLQQMIRERIFTVLNDRLIIAKGGNLAGSLGAASLVFQGQLNDR
ncbi:MAG: ROK family protein [Leptospira sp.]|nr:ROK family protein [Leptospira sp.]